MSGNTTVNTGCGTAAMIGLQALLISFKVFGVVDWGWLVVLIPTIFVLVGSVFALIIILAIAIAMDK